MPKDKLDIHKSVGSAFSLLENFGVDKKQAREDREKLQKKLGGTELESHAVQPVQKEKESEPTPKSRSKKPARKSIEKLIKDSPVNIPDNFTKIPNQIFDEISKTQTLVEQAVYIQILRKSLGWGFQKCAISQTELMDRTGISAVATLRKAIRGLMDKKHIEVVYHQPPSTTVYKINLIWDKQHNPSKYNPSNINPLKSDGLIFNPLTRQNITGDPSKYNGLEEFSTGSDLSGEGDSQHSEDPPKETLYKDTFKHTLSKKGRVPELIRAFYSQIGQRRISARESERAMKSYDSLKKDDFTEEEISFAVDWTAQNVKEVRSFTILEHTIGQALAEREKILEQKALEEKMEEERKAELEKRRREEKVNAMIEEYIDNLPASEKEALESQARDELIRKGEIEERYINLMVLEAKVKEIVRKERFD